MLPTTHLKVLKVEDLDLPTAPYHLLLDSSLSYLSLCGNGIKDLQVFCQHFKSNQTLLYLNLSRNQLHRSSTEPFFEVLKTNSTLLGLSLGQNQLTDETMLHLSKALGKQLLSPEEVNVRKKHAQELEKLRLNEEDNESTTKKKPPSKITVPRTNSTEEKTNKRLAQLSSKNTNLKSSISGPQAVLSKDNTKENSQASLSKHVPNANKKGRGSGSNMNMEKSALKRASKKNVNSPEEGLDEMGSESMLFSPHLEWDMFEIHGQYYGCGNRTLMYLNLSQNWITLVGVKYLFECISDQKLEDKNLSLAKETTNGHDRTRSGLHRLMLE
ncbi:hypothetical protein HMI54_011619, partial [Coelomomyces lativittatus]